MPKNQPRRDNGQYTHTSALIAAIAEHRNNAGSADHLNALDRYARAHLLAQHGPHAAEDLASLMVAASACGPDTYLAYARDLGLTAHRAFTRQLNHWKQQHRKSLSRSIQRPSHRVTPGHLHEGNDSTWCMCTPTAA